jgi:hypothetical protein
MRPAADAQGEVLEPFFESSDWEYARDYFLDLPALRVNRKPTALGGLEVFGVVFAFIGTCFAKKIFDEVYERTLKRPIGAFLDSFFAKAEVPSGKSVEYRDIIYFEDIDLVVVVRVLATKETTKDVQTWVMHAHRIAHAFIESHGRKAPIHCHSVVDGQASADPELFQTLEEIKHQDRAKAKLTWRK